MSEQHFEIGEIAIYVGTYCPCVSLRRPYLWPHDYGDWKNILRGPRHKAFEPPGRCYLNGSTQYCQRSNYRRDFRVMLAYQRNWM